MPNAQTRIVGDLIVFFLVPRADGHALIENLDCGWPTPLRSSCPRLPQYGQL
jgi:hypothetical protein